MQLPSSCYNHNTLDNPQNIVCEGVITNARYFKVVIRNFKQVIPPGCSEGCQGDVHVIVRLGSCLLGCFNAISL